MKRAQRPVTLLLIATLTFLCLPISAQEGRLTCASNNGRYRYCRADTQNRVQLTRQLSGSRCNQGYSWGFDYRGIWVDRGCRAEFVYGKRNNGGNTGAAVAAGILGGLILGAAVASSKDDNSDDRAQRRNDAYQDGYRQGQRDWDDDRDPNYRRYSGRVGHDYESDFAQGYDDGYNNRQNKYR
ncbi:MAG TPA: DUF3011 domain-containing protein [Candidatus Acidoferrales bacterium]